MSSNESFPDFVDEYNNWQEYETDQGIYEAYLNHCIVHCRHQNCGIMRHRERKAGRNWKCKSCTKSKAPVLNLSSKEQISQITKADVKNAAKLYASLDQNHVIQINLHTANALVGRAAILQLMWFRTHLLENPAFESSSMIRIDGLRTAAMDANKLISGFGTYFTNSLTHLPGQTRKIKREDLEAEIRDSLKTHIVEWMCRWCLLSSYERRHKWAPFAAVVEGLANGRWGEGIMLVFDRMEELIGTVMGLLAWWDVESRKRWEKWIGVI